MIHANRRGTHCVIALLVCCFQFLPSTSFGSVSTVRVKNGPESDLVATGDILTHAGGEQLGEWSLRASVSETDFSNDFLFGGGQGVQYTMLNPVFGSTDTNEMVFSVDAVGPAVPQITLRQTPYFQDPNQWNGGNKSTDIAQFTLRWDGGGSAVVRDPLGQFEPLPQQANADVTVGSGTTFTFSDFQIFNSDDEWAIELPLGVDSIELDWRSSQPTAGSDLTREWVAFDTNFVPEPDGRLLFLLACLFGLAVRRRVRK